MAKSLDKILVIDIEATCWKDGIPAGQRAEIIEIGITVVDVATLLRETTRSILVKPSHPVSEFCAVLPIWPESSQCEDALFHRARFVRREGYASSAIQVESAARRNTSPRRR